MINWKIRIELNIKKFRWKGSNLKKAIYILFDGLIGEYDVLRTKPDGLSKIEWNEIEKFETTIESRNEIDK
jgi:hypothetical protein